jgi:hypothetical protein
VADGRKRRALPLRSPLVQQQHGEEHRDLTIRSTNDQAPMTK